jgi:hypothetical protein
MRKVRTAIMLAVAGLCPLGLTGCIPFNAGFQPFSMGIFTPIPVMPWVTERMEEKYCHKNDYRTPIMPPIRSGYPVPTCEDQPGMGEVLRAMPHIPRGVPYIYEEFRDDIRVINERIVDRLDPPRFYPLVGPAQLHHCHWRCTIYYVETVESNYPFPYRCVRPRTQVIYLDKDHLHQYVGTNPDLQDQVSRDLVGY